jgi:hypothetical protein
LTVPQVWVLLKTVLPFRQFSVAETIRLVEEIQQKPYRAYLSHRKKAQHPASDGIPEAAPG